jgi:hypothetical protein
MTRWRRWAADWQAWLDAELLTAVCRERITRSRLLLILGADPDVMGWRVLGLVSALSAACICENPALVALLLENGADPDGNPFESDSPLSRVSFEFASEADKLCADLLLRADVRP